MNKNVCKMVGIVILGSMLFAPLAYGEEKGDYIGLVNGIKITAPIYENIDHAHMLPIREVGERLGYSVKYNGTDRTVTVSDGTITSKVYIGQDRYLIDNDMIYELQAPAELTNNKVYVPSLFFSKIFGVTMINEANGIINISLDKSLSGIIKNIGSETMTITAADGVDYIFDIGGADKKSCYNLAVGEWVTVFFSGEASGRATILRQEAPVSRQITGVIKDAAMSTITITSDGEDYSLGTAEADKSGCNGLVIGTEVTIVYTGDLEKPESVKVLSMYQR